MRLKLILFIFLSAVRLIRLMAVFSFIIFHFLSCQRETEPLQNPQVSLTVEDVSCTETWLRIEVRSMKEEVRIELSRNDSTIQLLNSSTSFDSLIYDSGLLPNREYAYTVKATDAENRLTQLTRTATTMDTTSHNFTWQSWTFGAKGSSVLYDVAIISPQDIWCVGEIHTEETDQFDSLGNWIQPYNAVHWDGNEWELKRIYFPAVCGQTNLSPYAAKAIFAFGGGQVWISSSGDKIAILKENIQIDQFCIPQNVSMSINKMWGTSSGDLYVVGSNGMIAHYDGQTWQRIESGTDLDVQDIWGEKNEVTGEYQVIAIASEPLITLEKMILQIKPNISNISVEGTNGFIQSIWFIPERKFYLIGSGVYCTHSVNQTNWKDVSDGLPSYYRECIHGVELNDIFIAGHYGLIAHWNGVSWKSYSDMPGKYYSIMLKENLSIAVGVESTDFIGGDGVISMGIRN
jgi:hypothetical protein